MAATLKLEIVTPDAKVFSEDVEMVTLPGVEGEMGIYPQHVPLMTQIVAGEIVARKADRITSWPLARVLSKSLAITFPSWRTWRSAPRTLMRRKWQKRVAVPRPVWRSTSMTKKQQECKRLWRNHWRSSRSNVRGINNPAV